MKEPMPEMSLEIPCSHFDAYLMTQMEKMEQLSSQRKLSEEEKKLLAQTLKGWHYFFKKLDLSHSFLEEVSLRMAERLKKSRQLSNSLLKVFYDCKLLPPPYLKLLLEHKINQLARRCSKHSSFLEKSQLYYKMLMHL